jgi:hypothetical protein
MRRWSVEQGLSLFFLAFFLLTLLGQSLTGLRLYNEEQLAHGDETISWARYLLSSHFGGDVLENWQSEFLQFTTFILATVWLVQRGSNESKPLEDAGVESDQRQQVGRFSHPRSPRWARANDWRQRLYENSLLIVMLALFLGSWFGQSLANWTQYNSEQTAHAEPVVSWLSYVVTPDFWNRTLQNWQSEFLAVGTMAVFTIYLRQRGSPESKPVGSAHETTGASG